MNKYKKNIAKKLLSIIVTVALTISALVFLIPSIPAPTDQDGELVSDNDTSELTIDCYTPCIMTLLSATSITLGDSVTDTVTFIGLPNQTPQNKVKFEYQAPGEAWGLLSEEDLITESPGIWTATSDSFTPDETGTWYFRATYTADDTYCANESGANDEPLSVGCYTPQITTLLSDSSIVLGDSITDNVTFTGLPAYTPVNIIIFQHMAPGESTWTTFSISVLVASTPGVWTATSDSFTPNELGTWHFRAIYAADSNYCDAASADNAELLEVSILPGIHIDKTANKCIIFPGEDITYYFLVNNTGDVRLNITSLTDDVLGDILNNPDTLLTGDSNNDSWLNPDEHWIYSLTQHWNWTITLFTIKLPTIPVILNVVNGTVSYYDLTLSGVPAGNYDVTNGHYLCWCIDRHVVMPRGVNHSVTLYSSYNLNLPAIVQSENWSKINYILNHKNGYDKTAIQDAIWYFMNHLPTTNPSALALIQNANTNGTTFKPYVGQIIAVIAVGSLQIQNTIFEVRLPDYPITNTVRVDAIDLFGTPVSGSDSLTVWVRA
jgi:uncharacterized repeat protein (TIGR01451 family)